MPLYQQFFNGCRVVTRPVQRKKGDDVRKQTMEGGNVDQQPKVALKNMPAIPKEQDKKVLRKKMAAELLREL